MAPYRLNNSPLTDSRIAHNTRMPSPKSAYPQHQPPPPAYAHHQEVAAQAASESGPVAVPTAAEASAQRLDDRPPLVGPKRMREWEEETVVKKQANEENRARLDDLRHRRPSMPPRDAYRRNSSETRRLDESRRGEEAREVEEAARPQSEGYHPSEAAHHAQLVGPNQLPPMQQPAGSAIQSVSQEKSQSVPSLKEERSATEQGSFPPPPPTATEPERAARKMDVDEDYDDSGEDDKKAALINGSAPGPGSTDGKTSTPNTGRVNGASGATTKAE